jgi:hypothetical protein
MELRMNSIRDAIEELKTYFNALDTPCFSLEAEHLYGNAEYYLDNLQKRR